MAEVLKPVLYSQCDRCRTEWPTGAKRRRQCPGCGTRKWDCGPAAAAVRPARILKTPYLNARPAKLAPVRPYRTAPQVGT